MQLGCAQQQQYKTVEQICLPGVTKAEAMQIAQDVLAKMHFTIDKADLDTGVIRTRPLPGAQFFEFWRSDNVGAFNAVEANLHSIRRTAKIDITQKTEDGRHKTKDARQSSVLCPLTSVFCVSCDVQVQRLSLPAQHQLSNKPGQLTQTTGAQWIDLGQDTKLATEILKRIEQRATRHKGAIGK